MRLYSKQKTNHKHVNLVLGGGGIKGIAHVGAITALQEHGYSFHTVAGCSVGSIIGACLAIGMDSTQMKAIMQDTDFNQFRDYRLRHRATTAAKRVTRQPANIAGDTLYAWVTELFAARGVYTFADLKHDNFNDYPPGYGYKLVVTAADVRNRRHIRLPWDYELLGLDPDTQPVADAIRAATALPFVYAPTTIGGTILVDGGIISNFPVTIFNTAEPEYDSLETIGISLSLGQEPRREPAIIKGPVDMARAVATTAMNAQNDLSLLPKEIRKNVIAIDTSNVRVTDFSIAKDKQDELFTNGYAAAMEFIQARP